MPDARKRIPRSMLGVDRRKRILLNTREHEGIAKNDP